MQVQVEESGTWLHLNIPFAEGASLGQIVSVKQPGLCSYVLPQNNKSKTNRIKKVEAFC